MFVIIMMTKVITLAVVSLHGIRDYQYPNNQDLINTHDYLYSMFLTG